MKKVLSLADTLKDLGNPFQEESSELFTLDTKTIVDPSIAALVNTHHLRGREKFYSYMSNIQTDLYKVISQNTTSFFKQKAKTKKLERLSKLIANSSPSCLSRAKQGI